MAFKIEENFEVQAPIDRVWNYLTDAQRVTTCLPGAELTRVIDERTFEGRVRVKVGPVAAAFRGTARMEEADPALHRMRLAGEGKEATGAGSARMSMSSQLHEIAGGTRVEVAAEIDVAGKVAQFGRGLMEDISRQLFRQFVACVQEALSQPAVEQTDPGTKSNPAAPSLSPSPSAEGPAAASPAPGTPGTAPIGIVPLVARASMSWLKRTFRLGRRP